MALLPMALNFCNISDDSQSDIDELNDSTSSDCDFLNESFGNASAGDPMSPILGTPSLKTPFFNNSPYNSRNIHFSPQMYNDRTFDTPLFTPNTPVLDTREDSENLASTMPTPDFSVIQSAEFSRRRITRTSSISELPETPSKKSCSKSRLNTQINNSPRKGKENNSNGIDETAHYTNKFDSFELIGKGSFSQVYKARNMESNKWFAIKVSNKPMHNSKLRNKAIRELQTVEKLNHPHVLSYIFAWENVLNKTMHIQMELCEKGSLSGYMSKWLEQHILNPSTYLNEDIVWGFLTDMVLGLYHIHSHNLIHLDIKPANIFISNHKERLKIGDFGQAIYEGDEEFTEGDARYLAPEVLNPGIVKKESDIFSLGATILEMASLIEMPIDGYLWDALRKGDIISLNIIPSHYSDDFKFLIQMMMNADWEQRPSAEKILTHYRIQGILQQRFEMDIEYFDAISGRNVPTNYPSVSAQFAMNSAHNATQKIQKSPPRKSRNLLHSFDMAS